MTTQRAADLSATRREIVEILVSATGLDPASVADAGDETLLDLGLDSLAAIEMAETIQDRYQVAMPDEPLELSITQITRLVVEHLEAAA